MSSYYSDFTFDYHVSFPPSASGGKVNYNYAESDFGSEELPGNSFFYRDASGAFPHLLGLGPG